MVEHEDQRIAEFLVDNAITTLANSYDPDNDTFFVVITKNGKNAARPLDEDDQIIVGELSENNVLFFITQIVKKFSFILGVNPIIFIAEYITQAFLQASDSDAFDDEELSLTEEDEDMLDEYFYPGAEYTKH